MSEKMRTDPGGRDAPATAAEESVGRGRAWVLVVVPGLLHAAASAVPFLPLAAGTKPWLVPALVVAAEAVFWAAALVFGREVIARYRRFVDPRNWLRKE